MVGWTPAARDFFTVGEGLFLVLGILFSSQLQFPFYLPEKAAAEKNMRVPIERFNR